MKANSNISHIATALLMAVALWSCASIGTPEGGPRDYTPPVVVRSTPANGATGVTSGRVILRFDEIVQLKDQQKKVVVSPTQKNQPRITALGRTVEVQLNDSLLPGTTYVIDFADAIEDNNEGNRLDNFGVTFSTGDQVDTLQMSGIVLRASDLEPMQHVLVGAHSNLEDSAFTSLPFERVARTNDKGEFTLRGLKPGRYHVFALNDMDGDYAMNRSEDYAFFDEVLVPSVSQFTSQDTTFTFDRRVDTVVTGTHNLYLPNDILLTMSNENYSTHYLRKASREGRNKIQLLFSTAAPMPTLSIVKPAQHSPDWHALERRQGNDSLVYWLTDSALIKSDSIVATLRYLASDSADAPAWRTDTLTLVKRLTNAEIKQEADARKELENLEKDYNKQLERRNKLLEAGKSTDDVDVELKAIDDRRRKEQRGRVLQFKFEQDKLMEVTDTMAFSFDTPLAAHDTGLMTLQMMQPDSTWTTIALPAMQPADTLSPRRWVLPAQVQPEGEYRLTALQGALRDAYGATNDSVTYHFKVRSLDDYGYILLRVNSGDSAFVQLLDQSGEVTRQLPVTQGQVRFDNLLPGNYYARLVIDRNGNGKWDPGIYSQHLQPEEVYYFPGDKPLRVRKSWGQEETWNIYATALNLQLPEKLKKNKPEKRTDSLEQKSTDNTTGDDDDDEFGTGFGTNSYSGNRYTDYQNRRNR